jgi:hypothetical protein
MRESSGMPRSLICSKVALYSVNLPCNEDLNNQSATTVSPAAILPKLTFKDGLID